MMLGMTGLGTVMDLTVMTLFTGGFETTGIANT